MFGKEAMAKLMSNPRVMGYFQDPKFRNLFEMCKQNPQMLMQMMQVDPRFQDVFSVLTGIDLQGMREDQMKRKDEEEDYRKKQEQERKKKEEEEEKKRKEEEEAKLPEEEKVKIAKRKEAETKKNEGNAAYKKKDFETALALYEEAIQADPSEMTYYTNKAAVYFEKKEYDKCIEECDKAIQQASGGQYDYVKLSKALARKANAVLQKGDYEGAIELYQKALLENNDPTIKDALKKAEKVKREQEEKKYINPEIAEEHRKKGNSLFE